MIHIVLSASQRSRTERVNRRSIDPSRRRVRFPVSLSLKGLENFSGTGNGVITATGRIGTRDLRDSRANETMQPCRGIRPRGERRYHRGQESAIIGGPVCFRSSNRIPRPEFSRLRQTILIRIAKTRSLAASPIRPTPFRRDQILIAP